MFGFDQSETTHEFCFTPMVKPTYLAVVKRLPKFHLYSSRLVRIFIGANQSLVSHPGLPGVRSAPVPANGLFWRRFQIQLDINEPVTLLLSIHTKASSEPWYEIIVKVDLMD